MAGVKAGKANSTTGTPRSAKRPKGGSVKASDAKPPETVNADDARGSAGLTATGGNEGTGFDDTNPLSRDGIVVGGRRFRGKPGRIGQLKLNVLPDLPDIRDRMYQPRLRPLEEAIYPAIAYPIRNQGKTSRCTGFALAHTVDHLLHREIHPGPPKRVSARMFYEMARLNDEWEGSAYEGSSIRGAISGFYRNGVCSDAVAPSSTEDDWVLTYEIAKEARETRLGAYYRLAPDLADYHAAVNEIGAILVSAQVHSGWERPKGGLIEPGGVGMGGHAFVIVGYGPTGFWVLNSWGEDWGVGGIAHWSYEDWAATVMDAWVLQLGVFAPTAFSAVPRKTIANPSGKSATAPVRTDIVGHFINIDDGRYVTGGRYYSPSPREMEETVGRLTQPDANRGAGFDHLVIYAHGGLNDLDAEANRIAVWLRQRIWTRNKIYNFHLMWDTGLLDEAFGGFSTADSERAAGKIGDLALEVLLRPLGLRAWRNMKQDAAASFTKSDVYDGGFTGLKPLLQGLDKAPGRPVLHLVGHSAGSIMLGELLRKLKRFNLSNLELGSIHLMAPACTTAFFDATYRPYLDGKGALPLTGKIHLYNLTDDAEQNDVVGWGGPVGYGRSLLYLVSRAYEEVANTPLAGMQRYALPPSSKLVVNYAAANSQMSRSTSHGGFDNDATTLTAIMQTILGKAPDKPPRPDELQGY